MSKETMQFQTETRQILDIMIHSLYSHKEVFLRELVSNASDAIDKLRFGALTDKTLLDGGADYRIELVPDAENKTITIRDNGIGMTRDELVSNIGTIARSGSREFAAALAEGAKKDVDLIGQFGVGFYSAFMVADRVTLTTRPAAGGAALRWESTGDGTYTIEDVDSAPRGTEIVLHLREDAAEFLDEWRIRQVIRQYSDYVSYPVVLHYTKKDEKGKDEKAEDTLNRSTALWRRPKTGIKPEDYNEFYKYLSHDHEEPLTVVHRAVEGTMEFRLLLFVPARAPFDMYTREAHGVRLYVKKMFVMDDCKDVVPPFLRFLRGVVDSEDLPLNISRETLQANPVISKIRKQLVSSVLDALEEMMTKENEKYVKFFTEMGAVLKEGVSTHMEHKDKLAKLMLFRSTATEGEAMVSLADYTARMKEGQKDIYYLTGLSRETLATSPQLEVFRARGIEVLLLCDPVDEWVVSTLTEFDGKKLVSAAGSDLDLGDMAKEEKEEAKKAEDEMKELCDFFRGELQDDIKQVRLSSRLSESPCCIVADSGDMSANMEQIMRAMNQKIEPGKKIIELNPRHKVIKGMQARLKTGEKGEDLKRRAHILYEQARIAQGLALKHPADFVKNLNAVMEESGV